ncbi:MAG: penicillin-binding protein 2 [Endomicrobium sp.]|jgi:penicillin-binding protein 2|nr:penicillin-binding protein 2 [Endomicrobium sp.]
MVWDQKEKGTYEFFLEKHKIIFMLFMWLFVGLSSRLFYLQILKGGRYKKISEQQRTHTTHERAPRGIIYSADGTILARNEFSYVALFYPLTHGQVPSNKLLKELSKVLGRNIISTVNISQKYSRFIKLADNLTVNEMFQIQEKKILGLENVTVARESRRVYHSPEVISHITGYVNEIGYDEVEKLLKQGYKIGDHIGRGAMEQSYDKYLQGKDGGWQIEVSARGRQIKSFEYVSPKAGANVYSTIIFKLQQVAYDALKNSTTGRGAVVVLDTRTGAVIVLVSCPGFDINKVGTKEFAKYLNDKRLSFFNRALQAMYPPGSVFKVITFAAAVELLNINPKETVQCTGCFRLGDRHYSCWKKSGHGEMNLIFATMHSCNIYFYHLGLKLGIKNLEKYAKKFYFGQKTGIDLPNEKKGFIPNPAWKKSKMKKPWFKGDTVIFAIGQGALWATPLQIAYIASGIANKGVCHRPYIVNKILEVDGKEIYRHILKSDRFISLSDKTWNLLHKALFETIENGTGIRSKLPGIKIAGKTGTAQNPQGEDHAWFISYAPADNPEIAMVVIVENGGGGGLNAVPIGKKIYETYFNIISKKEKKLI